MGPGSAHTGTGVVLVEKMAPLRSGGDVIGAICTTLGLSEADVDGRDSVGPDSSARDGCGRAVGAADVLLILDNCEHLVADVAEAVADLVAASDQLTVLTTSRAPLMIAAETVYPSCRRSPSTSGIACPELFRMRAPAARPGVDRPTESSPACARASTGCRSPSSSPPPGCASIPSSRSRPPREPVRPLAAGTAPTTERHRTLRAVIDWSWAC